MDDCYTCKFLGVSILYPVSRSNSNLTGSITTICAEISVECLKSDLKCCINFRTNAFKKGMNPSPWPVTGSLALCSSYSRRRISLNSKAYWIQRETTILRQDDLIMKIKKNVFSWELWPPTCWRRIALKNIVALEHLLPL